MPDSTPKCECPARKALEEIATIGMGDSIHRAPMIARAALAAPCPCEELYAALAWLVDRADPTGPASVAVLTKARAALAKARGERDAGGEPSICEQRKMGQHFSTGETTPP